MTIDVSPVDDPDEWNSLVEQSPHRTPFHRYEALEVMEDYAGTLYPYVGYKGNQPVGLFPVFSNSKGPVQTAYSPPTGLRVNYLGPILLNQDSLKERKALRRHNRFVASVDEAIRDTIGPAYIYVQTATEYGDPRPFFWNEYAARKPYFTYAVDLTPSEEDLLMTFSSDLRQNIRNTPDDSYEITETNGAEIPAIIDGLRKRHDEYAAPPAFFSALYGALPDGLMRVYRFDADGELVGGQITLEDDRTLVTWQGVSNRDHSVPVMDLMLWHVICQARDRGLERLDHGGANLYGLSEYKAKFAPEVRMYHRLSWSSPLAAVYSGFKTNIVDNLRS
ncbi:lipid II:glycine glycyltransferase FemX [Natronosalvus caseinilyticus]|uniref:lipid II:glycine glycyltransferase FemX n=1 Tax=Natronosalvus caseinilyticus TaxID=2953747 RepID=UPI0028B1CBF2|nr:GNAT family N-acetyltransferase [Natronosalvus caseinilyticus]